ncbi:cysteine desulfurase [Thiohalophilus sp.]|uniref:aminotransferase class V-fold PLP-dependent enzyme n=1 Tax=Thiohalophilus sp. TaxID=3028392 RepID=UPI002ACD206B|nr:cysteine desulfurase [Thiohalophilus sp.]MDZ7663555.1 cysteine desulfurase [Thiohalophilus sp.]
MTLDVNNIRDDFPILHQSVHGKPLIYLDNAATAQKPVQVLDAIDRIHRQFNSNVHRGTHYLSEQCTEQFEHARQNVRDFINAASTREVVFTSGTTGAINLVAFSFGEKFVHEGDEVLVTGMEHHSNLVPWQLLCERKGARLKVLPFDPPGVLRVDELDNLLTDKVKILAVNHVSNTLGTINPIRKIIDTAHKHGVPVLIDGAQGIHHVGVDVQALDCDFYTFSGHKMYGPTGIGVLYGKEKWLEELPPYQGGGDMVASVSFEKTSYAELPLKFEAGTINYVGAIGLAAAIDYLRAVGLDEIATHERKLLEYATERLSAIDGLTIYGNVPDKVSIVSFLLEGIHPYDTGMILDKLGIAMRTGTHCTEPLLKRFGIEGTARASFAMYNTIDEVDRLYEGIMKVREMF